MVAAKVLCQAVVAKEQILHAALPLAAYGAQIQNARLTVVPRKIGVSENEIDAVIDVGICAAAFVAVAAALLRGEHIERVNIVLRKIMIARHKCKAHIRVVQLAANGIEESSNLVESGHIPGTDEIAQNNKQFDVVRVRIASDLGTPFFKPSLCVGRVPIFSEMQIREDIKVHGHNSLRFSVADDRLLRHRLERRLNEGKLIFSQLILGIWLRLFCAFLSGEREKPPLYPA